MHTNFLTSNSRKEMTDTQRARGHLYRQLPSNYKRHCEFHRHSQDALECWSHLRFVVGVFDDFGGYRLEPFTIGCILLLNATNHRSVLGTPVKSP